MVTISGKVTWSLQWEVMEPTIKKLQNINYKHVGTYAVINRLGVYITTMIVEFTKPILCASLNDHQIMTVDTVHLK